MPREDPRFSGSPSAGRRESVDQLLVQQIRRGDPKAGSRFVQEQYPGIYRYLLYLTGHPQVAEDLTQETFLQAWRGFDTFDDRLPLRPWLHGIARREFLQALRSQRPQVSLEEAGDLPDARATEGMEAIELREIIRRLPVEEQEIVVLHYLAGYQYAEIARIVGAPVGRVRHRLSDARGRLQRELGEGDLTYLNQAPESVLRRWAWLPLEALTALEARLSLGSEGWLNVTEEPSRKGRSGMSDTTNAGMSRRKLLEVAGSAAAAVAAAGLTGPATAAPQNESEVIDGRLTRKVTLAFKAAALTDLCERLHSDTDIQIVAGPSVADEKVTLFCEKLPLRGVMRQLSRPFGYTWLRSRKEGGEYRYELVQDLRSQLLEEELRNRDRNAALLALEEEIDRFRPYLNLSPDEALERSRTAPPADKPLLDKLAGVGWGPIQMYFRLSPPQLAALRAGETLTFSAEPKPDQYALPPDLARGVLQCNRAWRVVKTANGGFSHSYAGSPEPSDPKALPLTAVPEVRPQLNMTLSQSELGQFTLEGGSGFFTPPDRASKTSLFQGSGPYAVGMSPAALKPDNSLANAKLARDPALRPAVTRRAGDPRAEADDRRRSGSAPPCHRIADHRRLLHPPLQAGSRRCR